MIATNSFISKHYYYTSSAISNKAREDFSYH